MSDGRRTPRVSVHVSDRVRDAASQPELVGLRAGASAAAVYRRLLELGYDAALRRARERGQRRAATEYARDPERRRIALDLQRAGLRGLLALELRDL